MRFGVGCAATLLAAFLLALASALRSFFESSSALSRARWAIAALQSTEPGDYINKKLVELADAFEQWFRIDKWNRQDAGGPLVQHCLEDDLLCIKTAIWCKSKDHKTLQGLMADCRGWPASRTIH